MNTASTSSPTDIKDSMPLNSAMQAVSIQPIQDMQFSGLHWIEASAGTGKTYTLSSLMVRILLEKYLPNQVIATTFTRKAAAELKSRVRSRLQDTQRYFESCRTLTEQQVLAKAEQESDPLYAVVLKGFVHQIGYACERLKLVIDQLDELFVGTLDSFSQKLLREFAFESGKIEYATITDDAKKYSYQLIHDVLREWIQQQPQYLIDIMISANKLKNAEAYVSIVEQSLNFASAQLMVPQYTIQEEDHVHFQALATFDVTVLQSLQDYYADQGAYAKAFNGNKFRNGRFQRIFLSSIPVLVESVKTFGAPYYFSDALSGVRDDLDTLIKVWDEDKIFKTGIAEEIQQQFYQHLGLCRFTEIYRHILSFAHALNSTEAFLKYHLASEVKKRLPQVLQQKGETTFAQQIRTLASALQGEQGQQFARYVHARYPLILVDEFQDTNQDQDDMLAQIWRHPSRVNQGCMIMVGDRKQAIYGFRGGDMLTFLKAHQDVFGKAGHAYNLVYNHRTVQPLVDVVDALFQRQMDFGEQVTYTPVQAGPRPHPHLIEAGQVNPTPLRWLQLDENTTEAEQVAWKIRDILNRSITGELYLQSDDITPITERDIAVLSYGHPKLDEVQQALEFIGITCNRESKKSVFASQVARDVGAVLTAIMHPFDEAKLKRALLSRLLGFNVQKMIQLELQPDGLSRYIEQFDHIRELWLHQGFLTAWQYALNQFQVWQTLVEKQSRDNERAVVNLRHLTELLSQYSEVYPGAQNLYHWYLKQLTEPLQREWEMERKLSNDAGVQLMTIHASKGLEFKIVFLIGADAPLSDRNKTLNFSKVEQLNPMTGKVEALRVVAIHDKQLLDDQALSQHQERHLAEHHRLWYVALTRASHRVYAVMSDTVGKSNTGLAFWRGQGAEAFQHVHSQIEPLLQERPITLKHHTQTVRMPALSALDFPDKRFYPRGKTSFSYLAQHLTRQQIQDALAVAEPEFGSADDEMHAHSNTSVSGFEVISEPSQMGESITWIKAQFPMGTLAGSFLHEIFEHLDFQDPKDWALEIRRRFKNDYLPLWHEIVDKARQAFTQIEDHEQFVIESVQAWLSDVLNTPLHGQFKLSQLHAHEYLTEFPFYLALSDRVLAIQRIHQLFAEYDIHMPEFIEANSARYLKGEIDLVFFDGQQYHIADYKSNFLGAQQQHYDATAIQQSMSHASYWLQAALYLVALHRYLSIQLEGYEIERDLGGASYLYLRGMNGQSQQGYFYWKPSSEFILRLDAILGYFDADKYHKIA